MTQTEKPTRLGFAEVAKRMAIAGDGGGSCFKSIVGLTGACTASEDSTFANPGGATKLAANGFALQNADTVYQHSVTVTNDSVEIIHIFTATGTQSVSGFAIENDDDDVVFMECCFATAIPCQVGDTISILAYYQFKTSA
jgi:hypothetical protein